MKKLSVVVALSGVLWFQSCSEIGPGVDFGPTGDDTVYTVTPEAPLPKKLLIEEFTGVSCPPCPAGHDAVKAIEAKLNKNVVVLGYHIYNYAQADPVKDPKSKQDFRTEDATDVANNIFGGLKGMPEAAFDRAPQDGILLVARPKWGNAAEVRAANSTSPVNIYITSTYDEATREATIKVKLSYLESVSFKQNLTVAIVEDSVIDVQKTLTDIVVNYEHNHVLRDIITPVIGFQLPEKVSPKVPGRVYERTFKTMIGAEWKPSHCHVVAFVSNDDAADRHVVNAEEAKLTGL